MNENKNNHYFSIIKLCCILLLIIYFVSSSEKSLHEISVEWFLLAVTLIAALGYELLGEEEEKASLIAIPGFEIANWFPKAVKNKRFLFLAAEILLTLLFILFYRESNIALFLLPVSILDTVIFFHLSFSFSLISFLGSFINLSQIFPYFIYCLFLIIIYYQNFIVIEKYRKYLSDSEKEEFQLKDSITIQSVLYKEQLEKSSLAFENKMLEEKTRLSQALHDKLGHSINGSVYQLEACKVLMESNPKECENILQAVIDNLRTSMDEIRMILRKEKPDKKRMAYLQLVQLCEECREKYGIQAEVTMKGEDKVIPEFFWDIILDNSIEAVTNALKYAKCTQLSIVILILHKVVRCSIHDNGIGCASVKEGMGLQGMKNRTRKVNGLIDINSENGFHINMIIPLDQEPGIK